MRTAGKFRLLRRLTKVIVVLGLLLVAMGAIAWFAMRDTLADKVLDTVESRLAAKGIFFNRSSQHVTWGRGLVLKDLGLFDDESRQQRVASIENLGIRIPLRDLLQNKPRLLLSAEGSAIKIDSQAGSLRLESIDFRLEVAGGALVIDHFEARVKGIRVTADGSLRWEEGKGSGKFEIPDLSPMVKAASWLECPEGAPTLALQITPRDGEEGGFDVKAELTGETFRWKTLSLDRAKAGVALADGAVVFSPLSLKGFGGNLDGALTIDYRRKQLLISKVHSTMNPFAFVASLPLKASAGKAMKHFLPLGTTTVSGQDITFDLGGFARSTGTFKVDAPAGISVVSKVGAIPLQDFRSDVKFAAGALTIDGSEFMLCGGSGSASFSMPLSGPFRYQTKFSVDGASLAQLGPIFRVNGDLAGTMSHAFEGGGATGLTTLHGSGRVTVTTGRIYAVPFFGSLRSFLVGQSAQFGKDAVEGLNATYTIADGTIRSPDLQIDSNSTVVKVEGELDLQGKTVDATAHANLKGIIGVATAIPSKILEVRGEGPFKDVHWHLAHLPPVAGGAAKTVIKGVQGAAKATGGAVKGAGTVIQGVGDAAGKLFDKRPGLIVPRKEQ